MDELRLEAVDSMDLEEEEAVILFQEMDENKGYSLEIARKGLLSLSFINWANNLCGDEGGSDWKEAMVEFRHIARDNGFGWDLSDEEIDYIEHCGISNFGFDDWIDDYLIPNIYDALENWKDKQCKK